MKRLMTIALGLGLVLGLTTATFAQDKSTKSTKSSKSTKKGKSTDKSTSKM